MTEYFIYYTESNIVCVVIFMILLLHDLFNVDKQEKQLKYDHALIAFMLYFISDAIWASVIAGILPRTRFTVVVTNLANYILLAAITYMWLRYVMAVEQIQHRERRITKFAVLLPFLLSCVLLVLTYFLAPEKLVSSELELQPAYDIFQITVPIIYIIAVMFFSLRKARSEKNPIEKRQHLYIGLFPLVVIAGGLLQVIALPNTPIFCFACTILMLVFYIQSMETQISLDPLTGLNNRGQLLRYVSQRSNLHMDGKLTFIVMIDVNSFKGINDTYGHAEGDRALRIIAESLRLTVRARSMPVFLGRYGGDEFILIAHPVEEEDLERMIGDLRRQIAARCRESGCPYVLSVGVGYDRLLGDSDTVQKCLQRADKKLYLDKEYSKLQNQTEARG